MAAKPVFLSLTPLSSYLAPRSISFLSSDRFRLLLGGFRSDSQRDASPTVFLSPFCFEEHTVDIGQATIRCEHGQAQLIQHGRDNTTLHNGRPLLTDERIQLHHEDTIELGHYDWLVGTCIVNLRLRIHLSDSPSSHPLASEHELADSFSANVTMPFLRHVQALRSSELRLTNELSTTQARLQEVIDAAAAHTCAPPRSYGALLADLRAPGSQDDIVACVSDRFAAPDADTAGLDAAGSPSASPLSPPPALAPEVPPIPSTPTVSIPASAVPLIAKDDPCSSVRTSVLTSVLVDASMSSQETQLDKVSALASLPGASQQHLNGDASMGTGPDPQYCPSATYTCSSTELSSAPSASLRIPSDSPSSDPSHRSQPDRQRQDTSLCDVRSRPPPGSGVSESTSALPLSSSTAPVEALSLRSFSYPSSRRRHRGVRFSNAPSRARRATAETQLATAALAVDRVRIAWIRARSELPGASIFSFSSSPAASAAAPSPMRESDSKNALRCTPAPVSPKDVCPMSIPNYSSSASTAAAFGAPSRIQQHYLPNGSNRHPHAITPYVPPLQHNSVLHPLQYPATRLAQLLTNLSVSPFPFSMPASVPFHQSHMLPFSSSSHQLAPPLLLGY
ncbi:hypothetical protein CF319_g8651 [Tilletia indica]|nr:hypothetical protein CF319_g8651 [Tilletia indica]